MSRTAELQKRYPAIPRDLIIEWDVRRNGIRYNRVVDQVSRQLRPYLYQSRDFDLTLQGMAKRRPQSVISGLVPTTTPLYLKSGFSTKLSRSLSSPYELKELAPGRYALYEGEEKIEDAYFPSPRPWSDEPEKEPLTNKGHPVTSLVVSYGPCFRINPMRYCEYFSTGDQCKFCNYNATQEDARSVGLNRPVTIDLEETVEAYRILASEMPRLNEGRITLGGLVDSDKEVNIHLQFVEKISTAISYVPHIGLSTQPMSKKMMHRLRDAGVRCVNMNIEVWDRRLFQEVCPGKAKSRGYDRYLEAFQEAAEVFGWGAVGTNMPPGATLMVENGHRTWQEARDSEIEGIRWLIKRGVVPIFEALILGVGSVFGDNPANREKLPPTDIYLDLALAHHQACLEYDMYEKMDRLLWCPLDCLPVGYCGQIGMVAIAGDLGAWGAAVIPDEVNWLKRFIESNKPAATPR